MRTRSRVRWTLEYLVRFQKKDSSSVESLDGEEAWIRKVTEDLELRKEGHQERQGHRKRKKSKLKARFGI